MKRDGPLREGFTTGTAAAGAAKAATLLLSTGAAPQTVDVPLPGGGRMVLPVAAARLEGETAVASVIKDAGDLNVTGLAKRIGDLAARTRTNKVTPDELTGGTFTITNYGSAGTLFDTPIINQPQVAILGTGALVKRPVVIDDEELGEIIAVRDMMYLSVSYDHRLVDGAEAARFLSAVKARLEAGDFAAELGA